MNWPGSPDVEVNRHFARVLFYFGVTFRILERSGENNIKMVLLSKII